MIVTSLDTLTSLLAGISIFGILGNLAHNLQITDIKDVVKSGTGLAFISYPDAIAKFRAVPQMFAVLFFFMLFVLGVGSIVALHCTIVTVICDQFKSLRYWKVALLTSICGFLASIIYVTPVVNVLFCSTSHVNIWYLKFSGRAMDIKFGRLLWWNLRNIWTSYSRDSWHFMDLW